MSGPFRPSLKIALLDPTFHLSTSSLLLGNGKGIVVKIGERTQAGKISTSINNAKQPQTPLQRRLNLLGKILLGVALGLSAIIFGIGSTLARSETLPITYA